MQSIIFLIPPWVWLILSAVLFGVGEYLSKRFAIEPSALLVVLVIVAYSVGSLLWLPAILQTNQLAISGTLWMVFSLIATVGIGMLVFGEHLTSLQILGVVAAGFSIVLLSI